MMPKMRELSEMANQMLDNSKMGQPYTVDPLIDNYHELRSFSLIFVNYWSFVQYNSIAVVWYV